jgi:hypothetical protein
VIGAAITDHEGGPGLIDSKHGPKAPESRYHSPRSQCGR